MTILRWRPFLSALLCLSVLLLHFIHSKWPKSSLFHILEFWHFPPIFVLLKLTCLVTLFDRKLQIFKNSSKQTIFGIFNWLLSTQNVNVARYARNVEWDFFYSFQTPWMMVFQYDQCHFSSKYYEKIFLTHHFGINVGKVDRFLANNRVILSKQNSWADLVLCTVNKRITWSCFSQA